MDELEHSVLCHKGGEPGWCVYRGTKQECDAWVRNALAWGSTFRYSVVVYRP